MRVIFPISGCSERFVSNRYSYEDVLYIGLFTFGRVCSTRGGKSIDTNVNYLKLTFYNFLRFRKESRHMLKLLGDKCIILFLRWRKS